MIELLFILLCGVVGISWILLFVLFLEYGVNTWSMGDKVGASIFFLANVAIITMFLLLFIL